MEDVVKPRLRLRCVFIGPRIPRINRLRLSRNKSPVDRANVSPRENGQDVLERAPSRPRHVLRADDRATVTLEGGDQPLDGRAVVVAVKSDDVGICEHELRRRSHPRRIDVVTEPRRRRQWL